MRKQSETSSVTENTAITTGDQRAESAAHTPEPWRYRPHEHDDWGFVRAPADAGGWLVAIARSGKHETEEELNAHRRNGTDPYEANARLIASAPDMAKEIERLRAALEWRTIESAPKDGSRTLIAWLEYNDKWMFSFAKYDARLKHYVLDDRDAVVGARYWMPLPEPPALANGRPR